MQPLPPDLERLIAAQAESLGFQPQDYLRVVFGNNTSEAHSRDLSDEEFTQLIDDLSSDDVPSLPADFSRADIYFDHD